MKARVLRVAGISLLLATAQVCSAQNQTGTASPNNLNGFTVNSITVGVPQSPGCTGPRAYKVVSGSTPWGQGYGGPGTYFNLRPGPDSQVFQIVVDFTFPNNSYDLIPLVDGNATDCELVGTNWITYADSWRRVVTFDFHHRSGYSLQTGVHEFAIRVASSNDHTNVIADIRFMAVLEGTNYTKVLGYYDAPSLPLFILRDPPGGGSYSSMTTGSTTCFGQSQSVSGSTTENVWAKAKLGIAGEAGLFVTTEFEIYAEAGVSLTTSQEHAEAFEIKTCLQATDEFRTADDGTPDDLFIGSAIRYAYGMAVEVERLNCGQITVSQPHFASTPVSVLSSYHFTESHIRGTVIPALQSLILSLPDTSQAYRKAVNQRDVWTQLLAQNNAIKATAPLESTRSFNGAGGGLTHSVVSTTTSSMDIDYKVSLEHGLSAEFGVDIGGSGISAGGELKVRSEYGKHESNSEEFTNTMSYHLEDGDGADNFVVDVKKDPVFGTYAFVLDSAASRTSCRYEGGYQVDQPSLSVGTPGNSSMSMNEVPTGTTVNYPIILCNKDTLFPRTYNLMVDAVTNGSNAHLEAFGGPLISAPPGNSITLDPGQCVSAILSLTQPNPDVVDFSNINLYLYSLCDDAYEPRNRSRISISAHYGAGNFGSYCIPSGVWGPGNGEYVDGVQIGTINNTGTGAGAGDTTAYTDYSDQFSTALSRNAQRMITITSGWWFSNWYAAWIDYDRNGQFSDDEMLGYFQTDAPQQSRNIVFTVPNTALTGSTILRVRAVGRTSSDQSLLDACFSYPYGETEDYAVVINGNTPQDCLGATNGPALPGSPCDDGNADTGNDAWNANCTCTGLTIDCAGVPGGPTLPGTPCDDGDANTGSDQYGTGCTCAGLPYDCLGLPGGAAIPGAPCSDGNSATGNDSYDANCQCTGLLIDCFGTAGGSSLPGAACDDGNALSTGDAYNGNCVCLGTLAVDCDGVTGGMSQPGVLCNDLDPNTVNDVYGMDCICAGQLRDCWWIIGGPHLPGTPCDDGNEASINDVYHADCFCYGELPVDCEGVTGGSAQPGTPCDDQDPNSGNDVYGTDCVCLGAYYDCLGIPGGYVWIGSPCDDGDPYTINTFYGLDCICQGGTPLDCEGTVMGIHMPGTPCDDGLAGTTNDMYNVNCVCAGTLATDCEGVTGGTAQPGEPCNDGDATTGNDVYSLNCVCAGIPIDCAGAIGGLVLPGTICDDGDPCTANDVWDNNCDCSGTLRTVGAVISPITVDAGETIMLFIDPVPGATGYSWDLPANWTSANTNSFVLMADADSVAGSTSVCVNVMAGSCAPLSSCATVTVLGPNAVEGHATQTSDWFTVSPNPSDGQFTLVTSDNNPAPMDIVVYDGTGREVMRTQIAGAKASTDLDLRSVGSGMYYLMGTREGAQRVMPLMIAK